MTTSSARDFATLAGALEAELARRITTAAWRARRADRLEAALLEGHRDVSADRAGARQAALGLRLIRDGNGPRTLETLVRHRGSVLAELFRGLGALRLLPAETAGLAAADLPQLARGALTGPHDRTNPRRRPESTA